MDDLEDLLAIGEKAGKPKGTAAAPKAAPVDDIDALLAKGESKPAATPKAATAAPPPSTAQAANIGVGQGGFLGFGDELGAAVETGVSKIPGVRSVAQWTREHLPGAVSSGIPVSDPSATYTQRRDALRGQQHAAQDAHPWAYGGGELAGGIAASAIPGLGMAKGGGTLAAVGAGMKAGAIGGAGYSDADSVGGVLRDAGTSAAVGGALGGLTSKLIHGAPERVDKRLVANISRGEAGGAAKDKLYRNVVEKAGEEFEGLNDTLQRYPGVKAALVKTAASAPAKAAEVVSDVTRKVWSQLDDIYARIDKGPVKPTAAALQQGLAALKQRLVADGSTGMADVVDNYANHLAKHYDPTDVVTGSMMRKMRGEVGEVAFKGMDQASVGFKAKAKQMVYGGLNDAIEHVASQTPGVDVAALKTLNKDASMMIAVRDALADRAGKAAGGRTSLYQNLMGAGLVAAGGGAGGIEGAIGGAALGAGIKAALPAARATDFQLARLVQAARAGSKPAQLGQLALEIGVSRVTAQEIAKRGLGALTPGTEDQESSPAPP